MARLCGLAVVQAYATDQITQAERLLAAHCGDGTGCCAACGRTALCPTAVAAVRQIAYWQHWTTTIGRYRGARGPPQDRTPHLSTT